MRFGRYQVLDVLGTGGMGEVYRAVAVGEEGFEKPVVLKRILRSLATRPEIVQRFVNEARIAMGLRHSNLVQVLDLGRIDDEYFIVFEYVHGRDLRAVLQRCRSSGRWVSEEVALFIVAEVLRGLDYAHRATDRDGMPLGIIHRDVTPANILCSFEGEVKLADFGVARSAAWAGAVVTSAGPVGSLRFMSPEQALAGAVDHRSDLFSVGAVLYLMLCGADLYPGPRDDSLLERVRAARFVPPSAHVALPDNVGQVIDTALKRDPAHRFSTAAAMLVALERCQVAGPRQTSALCDLMHELFPDAAPGQMFSVFSVPPAASRQGVLAGAELVASPSGAPGVTTLRRVRSAPTALESPAARRRLAPPATETTRSLEGHPPLLPSGQTASGYGPPPSAPAVAKTGGAARGWLLWLALPALAVIGFTAWVVLRKPAGPRRAPVAAASVAHRSADAKAPVDGAVELTPTTRGVAAAVLVGQLTVTSSPPRARLVVDGQQRGQTPISLDVPLSRALLVKVLLAGHRSASAVIRLTPTEWHRELHFRLGRLPPAAVPSPSEELGAPELGNRRALKQWKKALRRGVVDEPNDVDSDAARREKRRRRRLGSPLPAE